MGTNARANWYGCALPAMIADWRALFADADIFWVVQQLHAWAVPESYRDALAVFREMELEGVERDVRKMEVRALSHPPCPFAVPPPQPPRREDSPPPAQRSQAVLYLQLHSPRPNELRQ